MEEIEVKPKGKRGRPPKNGTALKVQKAEGEVMLDEGLAVTPAIRNVIEDPILEPYKIYVNDVSYVVVDSKRPEGALMDNVHGYFTSIGAALIKITKLKLNKDKKYTLPEYVGDFNKMLVEFKELLKN